MAKSSQNKSEKGNQLIDEQYYTVLVFVFPTMKYVGPILPKLSMNVFP